MASGKQVAKKGDDKVPAHLAHLEQDAGLGGEHVGTEDMLIPFLRVAQALSDQVNKRHANHIPGLEEGDFYNSATQQCWKGEKGVLLVPVLYQRKYIEWRPNRGGYVQEHGPDIMQHVTRTDENQDLLDNGNEIVLHATWYMLLLDDDSGDTQQVVVDLSKTQHKKSRALVSKLKGVLLPGKSGKFNPPFFYNVLHATTVPEQNDYGRWMGWDFRLNGNVFDREGGEELYETAKGLYNAVREGAVQAAPMDSTGDDEVPF